MSTVYNRRLPVYLVLDCSESMAGGPLEAVAQGVASLVADLRGDPMAVETAYLSVITFAARAAVAVPLTELMKFQPPKLRLGSGTSLGAALRLLADCVERDVVKATATQKGDWKPLCVLLTDGAPTDDWRAAAESVRTRVCGTKANVIAVACGPEADAATLARVTPTVLRAADVQAGTLKALFKWVSASVAVASARLEGAPAAGVGLPPLPGGKIDVAEPGGATPDPGRHLYLHARCAKSRQFYLAKFAKDSGGDYAAVASHAAPDFDLDGAGAASGVAVERIGAPPACAYCHQGGLSVCDCGRLFCSPSPVTRPVTLHCPWCGEGGTYAPSGGGFDVGRGAG